MSLDELYMDQLHQMESLTENHAEFDQYIESQNIHTVSDIVDKIQPAANCNQYHLTLEAKL